MGCKWAKYDESNKKWHCEAKGSEVTWGAYMCHSLKRSSCMYFMSESKFDIPKRTLKILFKIPFTVMYVAIFKYEQFNKRFITLIYKQFIPESEKYILRDVIDRHNYREGKAE